MRVLRSSGTISSRLGVSGSDTPLIRRGSVIVIRLRWKRRCVLRAVGKGGWARCMVTLIRLWLKLDRVLAVMTCNLIFGKVVPKLVRCGTRIPVVKAGAMSTAIVLGWVRSCVAVLFKALSV